MASLTKFLLLEEFQGKIADVVATDQHFSVLLEVDFGFKNHPAIQSWGRKQETWDGMNDGIQRSHKQLI